MAKYMSIDELVERWGCPKQTVYQRANAKGLASKEVKGKTCYRFPDDLLQRFDEQGYTPNPNKSTAKKKRRVRLKKQNAVVEVPVGHDHLQHQYPTQVENMIAAADELGTLTVKLQSKLDRIRAILNEA